MALNDDGCDKEWLHSLLLDVQLEHFHTRIIDELQVRFKSTIFLNNSLNLNNVSIIIGSICI